MSLASEFGYYVQLGPDEQLRGVGTECIECSSIAFLGREPVLNEPCPDCGSTATQVVVVEDCDGLPCDSSDHHYGIGLHVRDDSERPQRLAAERKRRIAEKKAEKKRQAAGEKLLRWSEWLG